MSRIQQYLQQASEEAHLSDMAFRHGAIVVSGGRVMTTGHNETRPRINKRNYCSTLVPTRRCRPCTGLNRVWPRTCRGTKNKDTDNTSYLNNGHKKPHKRSISKRNNKRKSAHNRNATRSGLHSADLYVVRVSASGEFCNSKPCHLCVQWMAHYGVKRVFYSTGPSASPATDGPIKWEVELVADLLQKDRGYTTRSERYVTTQFGQILAGAGTLLIFVCPRHRI